MPHTSRPPDTESADRFVTREGDIIPLDPAHRSSVRLASATGYGCSPGAETASDEEVKQYVAEVGHRIHLMRRLAALGGMDVEGADVLIVGASDGAEAIWCAGLGAASVTGTDHGEVFVGDGAALAAVRGRILDVATRHAEEFGFTEAAGDVPRRFLVDDITDSRLEADSFDLVLSWQTLEHVPDVAAMMRHVRRLLRPGGVTVHEYNPFFSVDGGHSRGTLDMPWGHVRLDEADLEQYLRMRRPDEAESALAFLHGALNRATQADVRDAVDAAGLVLEAWLPRTRTEDLLILAPDVLAACRRTHPRVQVVDLVSRIVRLVARRPD